jgi:hypothetical protein
MANTQAIDHVLNQAVHAHDVPGVVAMAALRSRSSRKQPQLTRIVVPLDERQELPHHRGTALVTL